jgi:phosphatidylserine synthase
LNTQRVQASFLYRNLANATSILGVLPLVVLFLDDGYKYVLPLIIFNNIMDDLDGVLAAKLNIRSQFGADLDNVCDAVAHVILTLVVGAHFGGLVMAAGAIAAGSILVRVVTRLNPGATTGTGSQTNELMRHMLFTLLLTAQFDFPAETVLIVMFLLHSVSMLVPFKMPALLGNRLKGLAMAGIVNVALLAAWLLPPAAPLVAALFIGSYLYAFAAGAGLWRKRHGGVTGP